jgi:hypothetical protein
MFRMKSLMILAFALATAGGLAGQDRATIPPLEDFAIAALEHLQSEGIIPDTFQLRRLAPFPANTPAGTGRERFSALFEALGPRLGVEFDTELLPRPPCRKVDRVYRGETRRFTICEPDPVPRAIDIRGGFMSEEGSAHFGVTTRNVVAIGVRPDPQPLMSHLYVSVVVTMNDSGELEARIVEMSSGIGL